MVHNSKAKTEALVQFILEHVVDYKSHFEVSDVKRDGTVFVKFRGGAVGSASERAMRFNDALCRANRPFQQVDANKFRLALEQF